MLFKVTDSNNDKFIEYVSLCLSSQDLEDTALFCEKMLPKLKAIKSGLFSNATNCSYNYYGYKNYPLLIDCYVENRGDPFYLKEMVSQKRQKEIDAYQAIQNQAYKAQYTWSNADSWTIATGPVNPSYSYSTTISTVSTGMYIPANTTFTFTLNDGYRGTTQNR